MESNIPKFLIDILNEQYSKGEVSRILNGYKIQRKVTLRVNNLKSNNEEIEKELQKAGIEYEKVNFYDKAYIIKNVTEKEIQKLEIYEQGKIYLQSLSSMLPPIILEPKEEDILDMTAAPGGKTTEIAALTNNNSNITACEMNKIRADRLKYNIEKQGAKALVMQKDSRQIDDFFKFDQILLDAPCSGSGTLNSENINLEKTFTKTLIEKSVKSQKTLLKKAITLLKKNKEMVYSTCSILKQENEEILTEFLKNGNIEIVEINTEEMKELPLLPTSIKGTICVCPTELFEGFFVAKIRKIK